MDLDTFLRRIAASKQFNHFYHFTDKKNKPLIKEHGLPCTSELRRLGLLAGELRDTFQRLNCKIKII